jgi:hypothetical protein
MSFYFWCSPDVNPVTCPPAWCLSSLAGQFSSCDWNNCPLIIEGSSILRFDGDFRALSRNRLLVLQYHCTTFKGTDVRGLDWFSYLQEFTVPWRLRHPPVEHSDTPTRTIQHCNDSPHVMLRPCDPTSAIRLDSGFFIQGVFVRA